MKNKGTLFGTVIILLCILNVSVAAQDLLVKSYETKEVNGKKVDVDKIEKFTSAYFEIDLYSMASGAKWQASKKLSSGNGYFVSQPNGTIIIWQSPQEFLNYMDARKYEMISNQKSKYMISYTFKRKS